MGKTVVVFGATGDLGGKIVDALLAKGAEVKAIVRMETDSQKIAGLVEKGVKVSQVSMQNSTVISPYCVGADCVVSALSGLRETVIDTQKIILDAAVEAGVPRFIPSDYSIDFRDLEEGENRNLDLRREFHNYLDKAHIKATSVFDGAFMELLTDEMPLIIKKQKRILCWGSPDQLMEFTTTYDVSAFTAEAALDENAPRYLRIAGDQLSCNDFVKLLTNLTGEEYKIFRPGGIGFLNVMIKLTRFFLPAKSTIYPAWQGMQYMRDMMEGRVDLRLHHNDRYPNIAWTNVKSFLKTENVKG